MSYDYKRSLAGSNTLDSVGKGETGIVPPCNEGHVLNPLAKIFCPKVLTTLNTNACCIIDGISLCRSPLKILDLQTRPAHECFNVSAPNSAPKLQGGFEELIPTSPTMPSSQSPCVHNVCTPFLSDFSGLGNAYNSFTHVSHNVQDISTPEISMIEASPFAGNCDTPSIFETVLNFTPIIHDIVTPTSLNPLAEIFVSSDSDNHLLRSSSLVGGSKNPSLLVYQKSSFIGGRINPPSSGGQKICPNFSIRENEYIHENIPSAISLGIYTSEGTITDGFVLNPLAADFIPTSLHFETNRNVLSITGDDDDTICLEFDDNVCDNSVLNVTPNAHDITTPVTSEIDTGENCANDSIVCNDNGEGTKNITLLSEIYISEEFVDKRDVDHHEVSQVLRQLRIRNVNRVIIGHLNVNFFAIKLDAIKTIIPGNVDIMVFGETRLDDSYPTAQLLIDGFCKPFRLDRNSYGGGLLIYVRSDIPCKQINKH